MGFPGGSDSKESCLQRRRHRFDPWIGKIPWRRKWQSTPVFLPEKSHVQRSRAGYSPWGCRVKQDLVTKPPSLQFILPLTLLTILQSSEISFPSFPILSFKILINVIWPLLKHLLIPVIVSLQPLRSISCAM